MIKKYSKKILKSRGFLYRQVLVISKTILRLSLFSNKIRIEDKDNFLKEDKAFLIFWHNRAVMVPYFIRKELLKKSAAIASTSNDGKIVADYLRSWGITPLYGSHGKGLTAIQATRQIIKHANNGGKGITAIASDGPTGPKYELKEGFIRLLRHLKIPTYIMTINYEKKWELKTWDKLQFPKPFGVTTCIFEKVAEPKLRVNKANSSSIKKEITQKLMKITKD